MKPRFVLGIPPLRILLLLLLAFAPALAQQPEPVSDPERLRKLEAVVKARRLIRAHESGEKAATPAELETARATITEFNKYNPQSPLSPAPTSEEERKKLIAAEVATRRAIREALADESVTPADPEVAKAIQLVRAYETAEQKTPEFELEAVHALLRSQAIERPLTIAPDPKAEAERLERVADEVARRRGLREQAKTSSKKSGEQPPTATTTPRLVRLHFPDADMNTVAALCKNFYPALTVSIAEGAKSRNVRLVIETDSEDDLRFKFHTALRSQGIAVVRNPDRTLTLDTAEPR